MSLKSMIYKLLKYSNDANAVKKGRGHATLNILDAWRNKLTE